jgi:hypothetical protein
VGGAPLVCAAAPVATAASASHTMHDLMRAILRRGVGPRVDAKWHA